MDAKNFETFIEDLRKVSAEHARKSPYMFGYPFNMKHCQRLYAVRDTAPDNMILDNCLDPFNSQKSHMKCQVESLEMDLVKGLARDWCENRVLPQRFWGYICTGGTEGNLKGLITGVQQAGKKRKLVLFSQDAHFSIQKSVDITEEQFVIVKSHDNGKMNVHDLDQLLEASKRAGVEYIIIMATIGTTFKGASDDLDEIHQCAEKYFDRGSIYLHMDAALSGGFWHLDPSTPKYVLGKHFHSISISGHKFYGGMVAACFFTDLEVRATKAEYLNMDDKTVTGSRNGFNPLMWIARLKQFDWKKEYQACQENLQLLQRDFQDNQVPCFVNPCSITVIFPSPSNKMCDRYQLATLKEWAHICMMPHISADDIIHFIEDLRKSGDIEKMAKFKFESSDSKWPKFITS